MAMTMNLLREPIPGEVAHSSTSAAFIKNSSLSDWGAFMTSVLAMMSLHTVEATEKYGATESTTQTTFNVWKNTDKPFFDFVKEDKGLTRQFAGFMKNLTSGRGTSIQHLLTGYDWASLGKATVVDVCFIFFACYKSENISTKIRVSNHLGWWLQWPCQYRTRRSIPQSQIDRTRPSGHH